MSETANFYQVNLVFPVSAAKEIAKTLAEHAIVTNLSYMEDDGLFNKKVFAIISYPADKQMAVEAKFQKYIKQ